MNSNVDSCFRGYPRNKEALKHVNMRRATCNMTPNCFKVNSDPFRTETVVVDKNYTSINNKLVGGQNPKTLIPPIIPTPMYSMDWRKSDTIVPSKINDRTNENLYKSGYLSTEFESHPTVKRAEPPSVSVSDPATKYKPNMPNPLNWTAMPTDRLGPYHNPDTISVEHFTLPEYGVKNWKDKINTANGYNPAQFENSRFPANSPQGVSDQSADMTEYHNQLFTQTIQPGVYYREDVVEPVNSNIGISFQQQFLPRTYDHIENGEFITVDHDPNFAPEPIPAPVPAPKPSIDNIYDPRFNGYSSSKRHYTDNVTGQPRFAYDDVNAVKMPNYITRSKIDTHNFSETYGPSSGVGKSLNDIRPLAQDAFYRDSEQFRNDISTSALRKMNAAMWQRRQAPLSASRR